MASRISGWFWQKLGGRVDEDGNRVPHEDDQVVIFNGMPDQAALAKVKLEAAGFAVVATARADPRIQAVDLGVSPEPSRIDLEVRAGDFHRAVEVLEG